MLRQHLWDYFGQQNEIRMGVKPKPEAVTSKPEPLVRYEQSQSLAVPYVRGGLEDQPYLWMMEHGVISQFFIEWRAVEVAMNRGMEKV